MHLSALLQFPLTALLGSINLFHILELQYVLEFEIST